LQTVKEHLEGVAELASGFASKFNAKEFGYIAGYFHDIGKYSKAFQKRLLENGKKTDHATAGARILFEKDKEIGKLLSYVTASHHSGLCDWAPETMESSLLNRLKHKTLEDYSGYKNELEDKSLDLYQNFSIKPVNGFFSFSFFIRMLFSSLVDADFLDTERFMEPELFSKRKKDYDLNILYKKLQIKLKTFENPKSEIGRIRNDILKSCIEASFLPPGFFTLTVPTGGGKTLSSLAFALNHCIKNNLDRIIYTIPYTSIIEQNAEVFKNILGQENVLEHHSNYNFDVEDGDFEEIAYYKKLAVQNWEAPLIVTTNVQFFESLFAAKPSKCRKLHNIANSVIILDEVQTLPLKYKDPCMTALKELVENYNCSVVMCSATIPPLNSKSSDVKVDNICEIIKNPKSLYEKLRRTKVQTIENIDDVSLSEKIKEYDSVLCVVNTKKHALKLHKLIENSYHLSTYMCPKHRKEVIRKIREDLKNKIPAKVISTQLIEAGVDLDFPCVFRSITGIDSIVQAAGRCNREGKLKCGEVFVFKSNERHAVPKGFLSRTASVADDISRKYEDLTSIDAVCEYFNMLYNLERNFDEKNILDDLENRNLEFSFKSAASKFKLIENDTISIIVPYDDEAKSLIDVLEENFDREILNKLNQYTVNLYENEVKKLEERGRIRSLKNLEDILILSKDCFYDKNFGIIIPDEDEVLML